MSSIRNKLDQLLDSFLLSLSEAKKPSTRKREFRISGLPFCPIRSLLFRDHSTDSFRMEFYTSIGTAVHETLQSWAVVSNETRPKIYACWKIEETGEIIGPCFYEDIPKKYHNYTIKYEEITIKYRGLSGHVDLVIEILPDCFLLIDFKTTNLGKKKLKTPYTWKDQYPATRSSIIQISSYATLLRKVYGINIIGWCLVYIDRGDVISSKDSYYKILKPWNSRKSKQFLKHIDKACDNNKRLNKLQSIIDKSDGYSEKADKQLKDIVKNRPCVDDKTYDEFMRYKFYDGPKTTVSKQEDLKKGIKNCECILKSFCTKSNKSCYKAIQRRL